MGIKKGKNLKGIGGFKKEKERLRGGMARVATFRITRNTGRLGVIAGKTCLLWGVYQLPCAGGSVLLNLIVGSSFSSILFPLSTGCELNLYLRDNVHTPATKTLARN